MADNTQNGRDRQRAALDRADSPRSQDVPEDSASERHKAFHGVPSQAEHLAASMRSLDETEHRSGNPSLVPFRLQELAGETSTARGTRDAQLELVIELGRKRMPVDDAAALGAGSVVTLEEFVTDPVYIHVNGRLLARGELVVMHERFCVRIVELISQRAAA